MHPIPQYPDYNHPVFQAYVPYIGWAKEHIDMAIILRGSALKWEVKETVTALEIPSVYHIHFFFRSITGINKVEEPIYGNHHILELKLPPQYPMEACAAAMLTDVWHPNVRSEDPRKGRVCTNTESLGIQFPLYQVVLRIADMLQYKNSHAEDKKPFPEDSKVARWVKAIAEPRGYVNKAAGIYTDDIPHYQFTMPESEYKDRLDRENMRQDTPPTPTAPEDQVSLAEPPEENADENPKIRIGRKQNIPPSPPKEKTKIKIIRKRDQS